MTIDFRMSQDGYLLGCRYRAGRQRIKNIAGFRSLVFAVILLIVSLILRADTAFYFFPLILVGSAVYERAKVNAAFAKEYNSKPYLYGQQRLICEENGIRVQNAFEKYSCRYEDIYSVKCTKNEVIILLSYRRGVFVINRFDYPEQTKQLLGLLAEKEVKLDGKRK